MAPYPYTTCLIKSEHMAFEDENEFWEQKLSSKVLELQLKYVDDLPDKQKIKIKEFRHLVKDVLKPHHNDFFLLKWLRARKFDLQAAEAMLRASLKWREEWRVDRIHEEFQPNEGQRKFTTRGQFGYDKEGNPIWIFPIGQLDVRGLHKCTKMIDVVKYFIKDLELTQRIYWRQTEKLGKPIHQITCIFDLEDFKIKDFMWKTAFDVIVQLLRTFEGNYPETLRKGVVINAPKVFSIFYAMCKPFISEETKNKLVIFGKDNWKEALLETIDANQLPKYWGGTAVDEIDGNPYCSSKVIMGGTVTEEYYLSLSLRQATDKDIKTVHIDRGAKETVEVAVTKPGSTLSWSFQTETHDIGFGLNFKPDNKQNGKKKLEAKTVIPIERHNCYAVPEDGDLICKDAGLYTLIFDNSFSWCRGKTVFYEVHVIAPPNEKI